ncbi:MULTISPECIES: DNA oxidative demethylase AlkB [unclassified Pseudomonas]|uniref:DNA oxidative demethylase AlkB n=1 Tax=unclassified Pseudomonas TaxID=196821 RepID=UPI000C869309|nr:MULTISPECIES: DNA oxidative demethylase AlkB [unclassified Pseudomonas]PMV89493.1 DNA oxidative demethylase AlkB [Pseudomonas sp. GW101-1A09]PMV99456.1 DNA oxidative demethylase AlkB [Pseudomonas sp. FW306-2-2C-B10A]PMW00717.1 DNA oxidative demethylase AlkB [Pseudomonas sp. GW460-C8]PMW03541.1 DNA oxidative demethylase AlkB [Pseudomonas sp. MPR-TSA4]PMW16803.1 DNA oxidative demethylase AlkB [Pseudomonas sp. FW306-2-1A-C05A]
MRYDPMSPTTFDLFADAEPEQEPRREQIGEQSFVLRGFALPRLDRLLPALEAVLAAAPFRQMVTPGGFTMSVALSSCGTWGWTTDHSGYRYTRNDPQTGRPWPEMPDVFFELAQAAAREAGFAGFVPDSCLINRYVPGAKMSLHQDKNEGSYAAPIVSVSLGLPAMFLFGGFERSDKSQRVPLLHGDIVVWGGVDRLRYHGVLPIKDGHHPRLGEQRINFTFRTAG